MAGRICKNGCTRPHYARGMCRNHYDVWRKKNPHMLTMRLNEQVVVECLPGTLAQLVAKTGLCVPAVERALAVLMADGPGRCVRIGDYVPPAARGKRWEPIYKEGRSRDVALTKKRKHEHSLALNRASYARRLGKAPPAPPPASWAAVLGVAP